MVPKETKGTKETEETLKGPKVPLPGQPGCLLEYYIFNQIKGHKENLVSYYLAVSYLWYNAPRRIVVSDGCYDWLCDELYRRWYELIHPSKILVNCDYLPAHTGFYILWDASALDVSPRATAIHRCRLASEYLWEEWK